MIKPCAPVFLLLVCVIASAHAQETVFNVPSGDVLDRGKSYGELDVTYQRSANLGGFTPRLAVGLGKHIEAGLNVNGISTAEPTQTTLAPTIKWKTYDSGPGRWAFLVGDNLFIPVQNRTYELGNYIYAEFTHTLKSGTRLSFGAYDFTAHVVARANRAGGQFAFEQPLNNRLTVAADWYTGSHALGYVTLGTILKLSTKLTWYFAYQIGNRDVSSGNHQFLTEIGWNFN